MERCRKSRAMDCLTVAGVMPFIGAISIAAVGCGSRPLPTSLPEVVIPKGLPVLTLPEVDFGKTVAKAREDKLPTSLGQRVPLRPFVVRFKARLPRDFSKLSTPGLQFSIFQRSSKGILVEGPTSRLKTTLAGAAGTAICEGVCPGPRRKGEAILEVRQTSKTYLVRTCIIE